ncbi:unnamed protein product, partial [Larinioides sclopetarius]
ITWFKFQNASDLHRQEIFLTMDETFEVNGCLEEAVDSITETQPYILCTGEKFSQSSHFIILDKNPVDVGQCLFKGI